VTLDSNRNVVFTRADVGSSVSLISNIALATQQWYHFAAVCDGLDIKLYVNGILEDFATAGQVINSNNSNSILFGAVDGAGLGAFSGSIDSVALYNIASSSVPTVFAEGPGADRSSDSGIVA
jgi:hypothetical protein